LSGRARGPRAGAAAGAPDAALERAHARRAARGAAVRRRGCAQAPAPCRTGMRRRRRGHPVPGSALQLSAVSGGDPVQASLMLPASRALPPRQGLSDCFRQRERLCTEGRSCLVQRWHLRCAVKQTPVWRRDVAGGAARSGVRGRLAARQVPGRCAARAKTLGAPLPDSTCSAVFGLFRLRRPRACDSVQCRADRVPPLPLLTHAPPSSLQCIPVIARVGRGPARAACAPARERGR